MTITVPFHPEHISKIITEEKTLTVRYEWEDSNIPEEMEKIEFIDSENSVKFADAYTTSVYSMEVQEFASRNWDGHRNYDDICELQKELRGYYPGKKIYPDDSIDVIEWGSVELIKHES